MTLQKESPRAGAFENSTGHEYDVRQTIDSFVQAVRTGKLDVIISFYADHITAFDMMPPFKFTDLGQYRQIAWIECFTDAFEFPVAYDYKEDQLRIFGDYAVIYGEIQMSGAFKKGDESVEARLRNTTVLQKIDGNWKIIHEHTSVPLGFDMKGLMNLRPGAMEESKH